MSNQSDQGNVKAKPSVERYEEQRLKRSEPEKQVEDTEEASLQDDSYSFDEENTGREEYHDASDIDGELDHGHQPI